MANFIPKITYTEINTGTPKSITFTNPPDSDPFNEEFRHVKRDTRSTNGTKQTHFNYNMRKYRLRFKFESKTIYDAVEDLILNHASLGGEFEYFESEDEVASLTMEYVDRRFRTKRPIPNAAGDDFEYDFDLVVEQVI